jgi:hypothetical protein
VRGQWVRESGQILESLFDFGDLSGSCPAKIMPLDQLKAGRSDERVNIHHEGVAVRQLR